MFLVFNPTIKKFSYLILSYDEVMKMSVKVFLVYLWLLSDAKHCLLALAPLTWPCVEFLRIALSVIKNPFWVVLSTSIVVMSALLHELLFAVSRDSLHTLKFIKSRACFITCFSYNGIYCG